MKLTDKQKIGRELLVTNKKGQNGGTSYKTKGFFMSLAWYERKKAIAERVARKISKIKETIGVGK